MGEKELREKIAVEIEDMLFALEAAKDNPTDYEQGIAQGYAKAIQIVRGL